MVTCLFLVGICFKEDVEKPQTSANGELMACSSLFVLDPLNAHNSVTAGLGKVCVCVCVCVRALHAVYTMQMCCI